MATEAEANTYLMGIQRFGALGLPEFDSAGEVTREQLEENLALHLDSLGPGDRVQITLTRGGGS